MIFMSDDQGLLWLEQVLVLVVDVGLSPNSFTGTAEQIS
jgi:hypothetical protein